MQDYLREKIKKFEQAIIDFQRKNYGERFVGASLGKLEVPDWAATKISNYLKHPENMFVYLAPSGVGKTYLLAAMTEWALERFTFIRKHHEKDLLARLRQGMSEGHGDYDLALQYLIDDDLIILDDVGSGIDPKKDTIKSIEWRTEIFYSFLEQRYNSKKPTIITSNFNRSQFQQLYPERVCSRLFAAENTIIEWSDGHDKRMEGK